MMTQTVALQPDDSFARELPASYLQEHWYAAYTRANHEKRVAQQLAEREVEHFLPLYSSVRQWKDRRVNLQLPLFQGYIFARFRLNDRLRILQIPGVARLVGFDGLPTALPDAEIEALQNGLGHKRRAEPHPFLTAGRRVQITEGSFKGLEGILVRRKNKVRVVLSLDLIQRSIAVEVDISEIEPVHGERTRSPLARRELLREARGSFPLARSS